MIPLISPAALITLQFAFYLALFNAYGLEFFPEQGEIELNKCVCKMFSNHHLFLSVQNINKLF